MLRTQIGGKYSKEELGLFAFKQQLLNVGVTVTHPMGEGIVTTYKGMSLCFDPTQGRSFYEVELDYYTEIKNNPVHIVHNKFKDSIGYIGESAGIEMAYAMTNNTPIVLLYPPAFSSTLPEHIGTILEKGMERVCIERLDLMEPDRLRIALMELARGTVNYGLSFNDEYIVLGFVSHLLEKIKEV